MRGSQNDTNDVHSTEDVDEDALDGLLGQQELERLLDSLGSGSYEARDVDDDVSSRANDTSKQQRPTSSNIKEVGGGSTVEVEDIHGGHGESSTVDEASNRTVELDEVEAVLGSLDLGSILLGDVAEREDGL